MLSALYFLCLVCVACLVSGAPAPQRQQQKQPSLEADDVSSWTVTDMALMRDTIEGFYETVVDDVMSAHTEELLVMLLHSPRSKKVQMLRTQASEMSQTPFQDTCVTKMPGYIGNHVHQLNARVYGAIQPAVGEALPALWPKQDTVPAQHELATIVYSLNQAVWHRLAAALDDYGLVGRVAYDLQSCDAAITEINTTPLPSSASATARSWIDALRSVFSNLLAPCDHQGFLQAHLDNMRADLGAELESRTGELVMTLYNDLYEVDEDF